MSAAMDEAIPKALRGNEGLRPGHPRGLMTKEVAEQTKQPLDRTKIALGGRPTDEGFRVIGIWESERAWQRFHVDSLAPAVAALGRPLRAHTTVRALHPRHVLIAEPVRHLPPTDHRLV